MNPNTGQIYQGEEAIRAAERRGEPLIPLSDGIAKALDHKRPPVYFHRGGTYDNREPGDLRSRRERRMAKRTSVKKNLNRRERSAKAKASK